MKKTFTKTKSAFAIIAISLAGFTALSGCGNIRVNIIKETVSTQELLEDMSLKADPVKHNAGGNYQVTFRRDKGGFDNMDLSMAYVAYYPFTITDQIETITGDDTDEIPPLPTDVQNAINEATGMNELKKIAIVTVAKTDDKTLTVTFHDSDPLPEREYFFIIPNEGLSGSVIPE